MSWYSYRPYVPVAERRRQGRAAASRIARKEGRTLAPIELPTRKLATTFWGMAWCNNLEAYTDFSNRLPRGRSYVRNGSVIDLRIATGKVEALVQGTELYKVAIKFRPLAAKRWKAFKARGAGSFNNLLDLLQGRLSPDILADITARDTGLFPAPTEIALACSCPDWASMCKHVAAVLYGVGARLDVAPELFFTLRGVDVEELLTAARATATTPGTDLPAPGDLAMDDAALSEIFGVEIEAGASVPGHKKSTAKKVPGRPTRPVAAGRAVKSTKRAAAGRPTKRVDTARAAKPTVRAATGGPTKTAAAMEGRAGAKVRSKTKRRRGDDGR